MRITGAVGGDVEALAGAGDRIAERRSRAFSGDQKIGSQPSAISNACATAFGPMAAR